MGKRKAVSSEGQIFHNVDRGDRQSTPPSGVFSGVREPTEVQDVGGSIIVTGPGAQNVTVVRSPAQALAALVAELRAQETAELDELRAPLEQAFEDAKAAGRVLTLQERAELRAQKTEVEKQESAIMGKYVGELRRALRGAGYETACTAGLEELYEQVVPWDVANPAPKDAPLMVIGAGAED